jgi:4-aminobutyrate--pyruvate transaminase
MGKSADVSIRLADRLTTMAPGGLKHVFFACSGSEAIETAAKIVRFYNNALGRPEKKKLIARWDAYHGSGTLSAGLTGMTGLHEGFDLPGPGILHTGSPHFSRNRREGEGERQFSRRRADELEALIIAEGPDTIAAFFAEPMIGSGGVILPPDGYWEDIQDVLEQYDILLVADEVITGFGRTGQMFGSDTFGLRPDLMTLAKQLTSAYQPLSATLVHDRVWDVVAEHAGTLGTFGHGFTYSGHPVACAAALATIDRYDEIDAPARAREMGKILAKGLADLSAHPAVFETRSVGLIGAVEFEPLAHLAIADSGSHSVAVVARAQEFGVIFRPLGDSLAICPPMIVTQEEMGIIVSTLRQAVVDVYGPMGTGG